MNRLQSQNLDSSMVSSYQSTMKEFRSTLNVSSTIVDSLPSFFKIIGAVATGTMVMFMIMTVVFLSSVLEIVCSAIRRTIDHHHSLFVKYFSAKELQKFSFSSAWQWNTNFYKHPVTDTGLFITYTHHWNDKGQRIHSLSFFQI